MYPPPSAPPLGAPLGIFFMAFVCIRRFFSVWGSPKSSVPGFLLNLRLFEEKQGGSKTSYKNIQDQRLASPQCSLIAGRPPPTTKPHVPYTLISNVGVAILNSSPAIVQSSRLGSRVPLLHSCFFESDPRRSSASTASVPQPPTPVPAKRLQARPHGGRRLELKELRSCP